MIIVNCLVNCLAIRIEQEIHWQLCLDQAHTPLLLIFNPLLSLFQQVIPILEFAIVVRPRMNFSLRYFLSPLDHLIY